MSSQVQIPATFQRTAGDASPRPSLSDPLLSQAAYDVLYAESLSDPAGFWARYAESAFFWKSFPASPTLSFNFSPSSGSVFTSFFPDAVTNISYNCLDRHVEAGLGDRTAIYFEPNEPCDQRHSLTYAELTSQVQDFTAALRAIGVRKGSLVTLYLPMSPALVIAMLACARIGAVHSVVFAGFSAESLAKRVADARSKAIVTCDAFFRGKKRVPLKDTVDAAVAICAKGDFTIEKVIVREHIGRDACTMTSPRDISWAAAVKNARELGVSDAVEWVDAEHTLFALYTSGSTGPPKGIEHTTGGYMVYTAATFMHSFAYEIGDVFFCTADCGWITGHSYVTYGPLLNAATQVIFEGVPTYPDAGRLWAITDKYQVAQLYMAPTAVRALKSAGDSFVSKYSRKSLRVLGTVGEPINPEAWRWYFEVVGGGRCPVVDTWWQTETGGHALVPLPVPGGMLKPGAAMRPFFGIEPAVLNEEGRELEGEAQGYLVIKRAWPSTLRTIHGDHARMESVYFKRFPGYYMTGDGCRRDADGHYWLTGRVDDVLNVSGHRIGTAEVEAAIVVHEDVAEAAVVGVPHDVKGKVIYAFVTMMQGKEGSDELKKQVAQVVREQLGGIAVPETIHWAPALPKTRSGKILRRILRIIATSGASTTMADLGDISTLADPSVVGALLNSYGR